jgi:hypothetical protein
MRVSRRPPFSSRHFVRTAIVVGVLVLVASGPSSERRQPRASLLGPPQPIADGVELFEPRDPEPLGLPVPLAIQVLHLDPARADLRVALAHDHTSGAEPVASISARHEAVAAINAGFFNVQTGEPVGLVKVGGELVSDAPLPRGAVAMRCGPDGVRLTFDRVTTRQSLRFTSGTERIDYPIGGVNTPRHLGQLMLYTSRYAERTGTATKGTEWILEGSPWRVVERRDNAGDSRIPPRGAVLSFGGSSPALLQRLQRGSTVTVVTVYTPLLDSRPEDWESATDVTNGAGLLVHDGQDLADWEPERLREGFSTERHPRTMIGVDADHQVWMVTIDGRNPTLSVGATFAELQKLAHALRLREALNLDGGGSTTMVVGGRIRNHPSDATGPRPISDAVLVSPRRCCPP